VSQELCDNWDQHWTDFSESSEMGPTTRWRCKLILDLLDVSSDGAAVRMLEVGSGKGEFADKFCGRYPDADFLGIELSRKGVDLASRRVRTATFLQRDLLKPPEDGQGLQFGATHAICSEVLEHLSDPALLLRNATAYMAPGCRLIVTVPGGPFNDFYTHIGHRRHYRPAELKKLLQACGFQVETCYGAGFPFFNLYRLMLRWRGQKLIADVSGPPSRIVRVGTAVFDALFRLSFGRGGWQTVAVARYCPAQS
jgi:SAM-dependent methyltransferase